MLIAVHKNLLIWDNYELYKEVDIMAKIAVEQSLTAVKQELQNRGHQVVDLKNESDAKNCDCCVISGADNNVMGMQNVVTQGSVIDASGLTAEEVCQQVENSFQA